MGWVLVLAATLKDVSVETNVHSHQSLFPDIGRSLCFIRCSTNTRNIKQVSPKLFTSAYVETLHFWPD